MLRKATVLILITTISFCVVCRAEALPHAWSKGFGNELNQYTPYVATDGLGNSLVAGTFEGTVDLGGLGFWSAGMTDIFLGKYDSGGNHLWSRSFGDPLGQWVYGIAVDASGNVIIAGDFHGTVNFGGGPLTSEGDGDIFLAKFDPDGNHLWSQQFGDGWDQNAYGVAVDAAGSVLLAGRFCGTVDFGDGPMNALIEIPDAYVAKFDSGGSHLWSQDFGSHSHWQSVERIDVDGAGNAVIIGWYEGNIDFGGGWLPTAADGQADMFVVQFDASGAHNWSHAFAASSVEEGYDVAVDGLDGIFITGKFVGSMDLGGGPLTSAGWDIFLARFDQGGNHLWSERYGDGSPQEGRGVVADGAGNVYLTGSFQGSVDFGGGPLTTAGSTDIFLAQFDLSGNPTWSERFGDSAAQKGHDLATYGADNLFVTGEFLGSVDFGGGALTCAGGTDIFVAKFGESIGPSFTIVDHVTVIDDLPSMVVTVELRNEGPGDAQLVSARMGEDFPWLRITDSSCYYGNIPEGTSSWGENDDSYTLRLLDGYPGGSFDVLLDLTYENAAGDPYEQRLELTLDPFTADMSDGADLSRDAIRLMPNWPNPFHPATSIPFELSGPGQVSLRIYDTGGRLVRSLVDEQLSGRFHVVEWDGRDNLGAPLPSGAYFYRLWAGGQMQTRRLVIAQ